jgi:hypothetical protein
MRKFLGLVLVLALVAAACGDDDDASSDPASIDSCEGLVAVGLDLLQGAIDEIDEMSLEDLAASEETGGPAAFEELEQKAEELENRAAELGCTEEELTALLTEGVGQLSSDSLFGQALIESIRSGEVNIFED